MDFVCTRTKTCLQGIKVDSHGDQVSSPMILSRLFCRVSRVVQTMAHPIFILSH